jgi:cell wall-associated NlpC family hydrolase
MKISIKSFIDKALAFKGQKYVWGGGHGASMKKAGGVDCSGLISQALQHAGVHVSGTAAELQRKGQRVDMKHLRKGDLVFIGKPASHVGIYMGDGKVLHASSGHHKVMMANLKDVGFTNAVRLPQVVPGDAVAAGGNHGRKSKLDLG